MSQPARKTSIQRQPVQNITILEDFSYERLKPDEAEFLRTKAANINARYALTHRLAAEMGAELLEAKARMPGVFLAWVQSEFEFSADTAENYMLVAANMPELANPEQYNMRAIYQLARPGTPQEARDAAAELAGDDKPVDYETAYILASAPESVRTRFLADQLTKPQAYSLARALNKRTLPPDVKQVAIEQQVSESAVVDYLAEAWHREKATAKQARPSKTYSELAADGWNMNGIGWSTPLSKATQTDVERYKIDRQTMHIGDALELKYDWLRFEAVIVYNEDGEPFFAPVGMKLPAGMDGKTVLLDVRIPRNG